MITFPRNPTGWACKKCGKFDWYDSPINFASPEHIPHRGVDIGTCDGKMIPLYDEDSIHSVKGDKHV